MPGLARAAPVHPALEQTAHRPWPLPAGPWVGRQSWDDLLFAHWAMDPELLRPLVPPPLDLETRDGAAWIGVIPFRMRGVMLRGLPDIPGVSAFPELNVRTYVTYEDKPGVWFFSLDAGSRLAAWTARKLLSLPYHHARMEVSCSERRTAYRSEREAAPEVRFRAVYGPTGPPDDPTPGTLGHWLTERYCLYARSRLGRLRRIQIHHPPWRLQPAWAEIAENSMLSPHGVDLPEGEPLLHFARRQDVVTWAPEALEG